MTHCTFSIELLIVEVLVVPLPIIAAEVVLLNRVLSIEELNATRYTSHHRAAHHGSYGCPLLIMEVPVVPLLAEVVLLLIESLIVEEPVVTRCTFSIELLTMEVSVVPLPIIAAGVVLLNNVLSIEELNATRYASHHRDAHHGSSGCPLLIKRLRL